MECTETLIILTYVVFLLGDFVTLLYATYNYYTKKVPYAIILTFFAAVTVVMAFQMNSSCHMAYYVWGAITIALLFCIFVSESIDKCMQCCTPILNVPAVVL